MNLKLGTSVVPLGESNLVGVAKGANSKGAAAGQPGSGQRVAWGAPNQIGHFTKGSSPREFGNKQRHDQMRADALGTAQQQQPPPRKV